MKPGWAWLVAMLGFAPAVQLGAQSDSRELLVAGVRAYQRLDLDAAVGLLERAAAESGGATLPLPERASALSYLGAANLLGGHRERATVAFRELVELDPQAQPDSLVFPPVVLAFYDETRRTTPAFAVDVQPAEIHGRGGRSLLVRLIVTTPEAVDVTLLRATGAVFVPLYHGAVSDSLNLAWNGRDATGQFPDSGRFWLRVVASAATPRPFRRVVDVPLDVRVTWPDTLAWPVLPAESLLPERAPGRTELRPLAGAGLLGAAVVALPRIVAVGADATPARFAVAAALGVAGIVGVALGHRGQAFPANFRANAVRVSQWKRAVADVSAENRRRREAAAIRIRTGAAVPRDSS